MSFPDAHSIRLDYLHYDLIRKIIRAGLATVDEMKLISPRWTTLVHEHLTTPARLPIVKRCSLQFNTARKQLWINIPSAYDRYYGVHKCRFGYVIAFTPSTVYHRSLESPCFLNGTGKDIEQVMQMFARCSKIEKLAMEVGPSDREFITSVSDIMGPVKVGELTVTGDLFSNDDTQKILDFVRFHDVKVLILSIFTVTRIQTSDNFFIAAALCANEVQFTLVEKSSRNRNLDTIRSEWDEANKWLNQTGQVMATLTEEMVEELDGCVQMRITVTKTSNNYHS